MLCGKTWLSLAFKCEKKPTKPVTQVKLDHLFHQIDSFKEDSEYNSIIKKNTGAWNVATQMVGVNKDSSKENQGVWVSWV